MIDGVSSLVLGPEDEHLYAAGTNASSVAVFARNPDGTLSHLQTRSIAGHGRPGRRGRSSHGSGWRPAVRRGSR